MNTYKLFEDVINTKKFKLDEMRAKIKKCYIVGDINEEEQNELLTLVSQNINPEAERPEWLAVAQILFDKIEVLEKRVVTLEGVEPSTPEESGEYEKWTAWDGISDKYQYGDIVEHNGVLYESIYSGLNVWEPGIQGTEALWKVYEV